MNDNYILMHKDIMCGAISIDRNSGSLKDFTITNKDYVPFLGNAIEKYMKNWWKYRAVPGSRKDMVEVIRRAGCETNEEYLAKNLALSMTDTYWLCPIDLELSWDDVKLYKPSGTGNDIVTFHNATSYDPNASLGGQMSKYWDLSEYTPVLVKKAYMSYGQQSVNELFAAEIHSRQNAGLPYVKYYCAESDDNAILCCCEAFTSESVEFVSAYEVLRSRKLRQSRSDLDQYIDICEEHGIDRTVMQRFMDYLILSDFAVTNTDEHLNNLGVLRNTDTMELLGPAPIFDTGNSMFYTENLNRPLTRTELLDREISSFHKAEEKMLKHVSDRKVLDADLLPSPEETREFYESHGIPAARAEFIAGSYAVKLEMLRDFQKGISISLYHEKQSDRNRKNTHK